MLELFLNLIDSQEGKSKFEKIYNEYHNFMFKVAISVTKNYHDAEDTLQNVLFIIAKNIDKIDTSNEYKLKSFLRVTVKNASIDIVRKRGKESFLSIDDEVVLDGDMMEQIENRDVFDRIVGRIMTMPHTYRSVLVLRFVHNLSAKEIAEQTSVSLNTVNTRLKRGKAMLSKMIGDLYDEG